MEQKETERKSLSKQGRKEKDRSIRGMGGRRDRTGQGKGYHPNQGIIQISLLSPFKGKPPNFTTFQLQNPLVASARGIKIKITWVRGCNMSGEKTSKSPHSNLKH